MHVKHPRKKTLLHALMITELPSKKFETTNLFLSYSAVERSLPVAAQVHIPLSH